MSDISERDTATQEETQNCLETKSFIYMGTDFDQRKRSDLFAYLFR